MHSQELPAVMALLRVAACAMLLIGCSTRVVPKATTPAQSACRPVDEPQMGCRWGEIAECERKCDCGDYDACSTLGFMYGSGPSDDPQSVKWRTDPIRALELFRLSCNGGSNTGCVLLGNAYERGILTPKSKNEAREAFDRACTAGYSWGCVRLGNLELGLDRPRAIVALRRACQLADAEGCWIFGSTLLEGFSSEEHDEARSVLMTGCTKGRSVATDIFSQTRASRFTEKACQKLRDLKQPSSPSAPARLPSEAPPAP